MHDLHAYNEEADDLERYINWKRDQDELFAKEMRRVQDALDLYEPAMSKGDRLTAKSGLTHAGIALQGLSGFFDGLIHDVKKAYADPRFGWPEFPSDNWKIPSEYGLKE